MQKEYIKDCSLKGKRIISALNNRLTTLEKVTKEIINYQKKFFLYRKIEKFLHKKVNKILVNSKEV